MTAWLNNILAMAYFNITEGKHYPASKTPQLGRNFTLAMDPDTLQDQTPSTSWVLTVST
jgi:hypothetical protein